MAGRGVPQEKYDDSQASVVSDGSFMRFSKADDVEHYVIPEPESVEEKARPPLIGPYEKEYRMNHMHRGRVIIFNHEKFQDHLDLRVREGTAVDKYNLKRSFKKLNFDVQIYDDLTKKDLKKALEEESNKDYHVNADCLVVIILSHGGDEGLLYASDASYHVEDLTSNFAANQCPALALKPKIFIIQACRGTVASQGVDMQKIQHDSKGTDIKEDRFYSIPVEADTLMAFSTYEGRVAHRNTEDGTWYIEELCKELDRNGEKEDLLSLLTNVSRRVAVGKEHGGDKQMPVIQSTLTRKLYFKDNSKGGVARVSDRSLEDAHSKLDQVLLLLETRSFLPGRRSIRKPVPATQWDGLKANIKVSSVSLPAENMVYRLGRALQLFLEDEPQSPEVQQDGETLLQLVAAWDGLEQETRCFAYRRLVTYLQKRARDWRSFSLLDIPEEAALGTATSRRWSHSSVDCISTPPSKTSTLPRNKKPMARR